MTGTRWTLIGIAALLALGLGSRPAGIWAARHGVSEHALVPLLALWRTGPNEEDRATRTRGYYQGLLEESAAATQRGLLSLELEAADFWREVEQIFYARHRDDFLLFDLPPNLDVAGPLGRLRTNAFGQSDDDYTLEKPPGVHRAALLGSSLSRACGASPGANYEALLERRLNAAHRPEGVERIEILNFAVDAYRPEQMLACAQDRCPAFQPDVYLWELSQLSSPGMWSEHLIALVTTGTDLRYPFLKEVAREAGLSRYDAPATVRAKLAPQRMRVQRWVLESLRDHVRASGAELVVLVLPQVAEPEELAADFADLGELLAGLDLRVVDVRDAFAGVADLGALRIGPTDVHPNDAGHRLLAERIEAALLADPELLGLLTGG